MSTYVDVSFIVPVFNGATYLGNCLDSILTQSVSKEILIVDDGSTDESVNIALEYAKRHDFIHVLRLGKNKGAAHARNQALNLARGEYLCFVDSDDVLLGNYMAEMLERGRHHQADLLRYQVVRFFQNKQLLVPSPAFDHNLNPHPVYQMTGKECLGVLTRFVWIPGICWTMIHREFLNRHQIRFVEGIKVEDQLFYIQLLICQPNVVVLEFPYIVYQYNTNPDSITRAPDKALILDHFYAIDEIEKMKIHHDDEVKWCLSNIQWRLHESVLRLYRMLDVQTREPFANLAQRALTAYNDYKANVPAPTPMRTMRGGGDLLTKFSPTAPLVPPSRHHEIQAQNGIAQPH